MNLKDLFKSSNSKRTIKELKQSYQQSLKKSIALLPKDADNKKVCWNISFTVFDTNNHKYDVVAVGKRYVKMLDKNFNKFKKDEQRKTKTNKARVRLSNRKK